MKSASLHLERAGRPCRRALVTVPGGVVRSIVHALSGLDSLNRNVVFTFSAVAGLPPTNVPIARKMSALFGTAAAAAAAAAARLRLRSFGFGSSLQSSTAAFEMHDLVALLDLAAEDDLGVALLPHLGHERLAGEHASREAHLDALEVARVAVVRERLERRARVAKPNVHRPWRIGFAKPNAFANAGIGVQRVPVAGEAVEQRLVLAGLLLDDRVGRAIGRRR